MIGSFIASEQMSEGLWLAGNQADSSKGSFTHHWCVFLVIKWQEAHSY